MRLLSDDEAANPTLPAPFAAVTIRLGETCDVRHPTPQQPGHLRRLRAHRHAGRDFATGPFRVWTGLSPLDWAGKVIEGAGSIGPISDVEETVELRAVRLTLALSAVPQEVVDIALA